MNLSEWLEYTGQVKKMSPEQQAEFRTHLTACADADAQRTKDEAWLREWRRMGDILGEDDRTLVLKRAAERANMERGLGIVFREMEARAAAERPAWRPPERKDAIDPIQRRGAIEVKAAPNGTLSGYLAVFGNKDLSDDVIERGAFANSLACIKAAPLSDHYLLPLLYQHDHARPIGGITALKEDIHGLAFEAELDTDTHDGKDAWSGIKRGYLKGLSIGFISLRDQFIGAVRHLLEIRLIEGSVVTFPCNERAAIRAIA